PGARGGGDLRPRARAGAGARAGRRRRGALDQSQGLRGPGGVRPRAGAGADHAGGGADVPRRLHADPLAGLRAGLRRAGAQHPSLAAPGVPRPARPATGARPRRQGRGRHRALRGRGDGQRSHRAAGGRASGGQRSRGDALRAHPGAGAPPLPGDSPPGRRRTLAHRGKARHRDAGGRTMKVRRALVSVHDKTGVVDFARELAGLGVEILSTGGTAKLLRDSGVPVRDVSEVTGFPEMLDGRVKTLHPKIHGGILARRDTPAHLEAIAQHGIPPIDLVVVALYPFEATVARQGVSLAEAIEQIDVGGPTMIRAAAKNHGGVGVVTDPAQYRAVVDELRACGGELGDATRFRLAQEAFRRTAQYDAAIAAYLRSPAAAPSAPEHQPDEFPHPLRLEAERELSLRYGENPHQTAAFYRLLGAPPGGAGRMEQGV